MLEYALSISFRYPLDMTLLKILVGCKGWVGGIVLSGSGNETFDCLTSVAKPD